MARFIESEKLSEQLRRGATERARRELSWDVIARETSVVYEDARGAHGQASCRSSQFSAGLQGRTRGVN